MGIEGVKNIVLVLSGKGGVGKSSVAAHLALTLRDLDFKVGLLDVDLCGPSIPYMLSMDGRNIHVRQCSEGWVPVYTDKNPNLALMSIGFLLNDKNDAIIWRGPKKNAMIQQFLTDVHWQSLDYLIVDMPPGTSDEHISLIENIKNKANIGAVLVTTPQMVAVSDVKREITFCRKASLPIIGIIENMSGFVCPTCHECSAIFAKGGGEHEAKESNLTFLGSIPIDPKFASGSFMGRRYLKEEVGESETLKTFQTIAENIVHSMKKN